MSDKYVRKYFIMEELDSGFGLGGEPEGYVKMETVDGRCSILCNLKKIKYGTYRYGVYLMHVSKRKTVCLKIGEMIPNDSVIKYNQTVDDSFFKKNNLEAENVNIIIITAEQKNKILIPMIGLKDVKWEEDYRNSVLQYNDNANGPAEQDIKENSGNPKLALVKERISRPEEMNSVKDAPQKEKTGIQQLDKRLSESFEAFEPFQNKRKDYKWYRVNDLAVLSNILFECNIRLPLFANPKILVGLFKYRHLLAGFYSSERDFRRYFVLGVPAKYNEDEKPFERGSRWVNLDYPVERGMSGYWLVFINCETGDFLN